MNPERQKYLSHHSRARFFIREVATAEDLEARKALIANREKQLEAEWCKGALGVMPEAFLF